MAPGNDYALLFEKIKATIQSYIPGQVPVLEGNASQIIFSGKYAPREERTFIRVGIKTIPAAQDSVFTIDKGLMDNITVGTPCKIYKAGSTELFTTAVIRKAENFKSIGVARKLMKREELYELKQEEEYYGDLRAAIKLKFTEPAPLLEKQVKQLVQPYRFLSLSDNADFKIEVGSSTGTKKALLTDRNDILLWSGTVTKDDSLSATDKKEMIASIKKAMRVKYLRTMPDGGDFAAYIKAEIVPAKEYPAAGIVMQEGDGYSLRIRNNSDTKLFYTVLDIYPDNQVTVLYPYKGKEPSDYMVDKNATIVRKLSVSKGTPLGTEYLKIIVSKEPMDLRSVFEKTIQRDEMRSFQVVLDDLFNEHNGEKTTRADVSSIKVEEIGIVTVHFTIKAPGL